MDCDGVLWAGSAADLMSICNRMLTEQEVAVICKETLSGLAYYTKEIDSPGY
eukprot:TRINITY_DN1898_c0_g1_i1.p3 TRINITY_DN1898_c0_g1~~TRINITY_DN1898_c0_g1_i1.p3  ORF type:complete len:52 (-),score=2.94 TRINITY_DN1898_c0_g1_i1:105-260(-)